MIERLCVIGVGLIGGSIARAAREQRVCRTVVGVERDRSILDRACAMGVIDEGTIDLCEGTRSADLVVVATPVGAAAPVFKSLRGCWLDGAVYTDVCSTKRSVVEAVRSAFGSVPPNFVPGHPIAGAERSGVGASRADLYRNKRVIVTPLAETSDSAVAAVTAFWEALGAQVSVMDPAHHDEVLAATSHLPHVVAYALVSMLGRKDEQRELLSFAASGFGDFTRIASSDPGMWRDICLANRDQIVPLINQLIDELAGVAEMIEHDSIDRLQALFRCANAARQRFLNQNK